MRPLDRKALRKSIWSSISRLIGVSLGAGAGSLIYQLVGGGINGWPIACGLAVVSLILMIFAEYEREIL